MIPERRNYLIVWSIACGSMAILTGAYLIAAERWQWVGGENGINLAIVLPIIGGVAVLLPIIIRSAMRR